MIAFNAVVALDLENNVHTSQHDLTHTVDCKVDEVNDHQRFICELLSNFLNRSSHLVDGIDDDVVREDEKSDPDDHTRDDMRHRRMVEINVLDEIDCCFCCDGESDR